MKITLKLQRALKAFLIAGVTVFALSSAQADELVQVTADNYVRAESDFQMKGYPAYSLKNLTGNYFWITGKQSSGTGKGFRLSSRG